MQIAITTPLATTGSAAATAPRFSGGITFTGSDSRFSSFSATAKGGAYGKAEGYDDLQAAIDDLTFVTVGVREPAAGIFERGGRFYGRQMQNDVTFASGKTWSGMWRLEQHPQDLALLDAAKGTTRADALRAVVDGAQRVIVAHLPVAAKAPKAPKG